MKCWRNTYPDAALVMEFIAALMSINNASVLGFPE